MKSNISRRILCLLLTLAMILTLLPSVFADQTNPFTDVDAGAYYFDPVMWAVEKGITNGTASDKFSPNATCTRGQVVTFLWRAAGEPEPTKTDNPFTDVAADAYFYKAVLWAVEKNITNGTDPDKFSPNSSCTRGQVVTFLWRSEGEPEPTKTDNPFTDVAADAYFYKAVLWAVEKNITNGTDPDKFSPNASCTRAQIATFLYRALANKESKDLEGKTVILHTNDTHGALLGFAQVAALKAEYEAKGAEVILADAGDYSQGTTYVSTNKGAAAVTMLNEAGYDVVTLGNHEFDFGYAQLVENMKEAKFQLICADVLLKETGKSAFLGHTVIEKDGVKIGFFGMETPETFTKVNPGLIQEITFPMGETMYACAQAEVDALKEAGADIIIGLVHLGVDNESEPNRSIDLYNHVTDIDFLIDGHSHTVMTEGPNGEPIQSTGTKASKTALMNVGLIQIDNETKKIEKNELIPLGEDAAVDEAVAAKAREIMKTVDDEYGAVFAKSEVELNGDKAPGNRNMETNLGDLITDSMRWGVLKEGSLEVPDENVVAITNGGGIRAWIHKGDVTKNDVNTVLPFGNTVAVVYVTGAELIEALEASTYPTPGAVGGFPQVAGIQFNIDTEKQYDEGALYPDSTYHGPNSIVRVTIDNINDKAFDPEATYAVVTNNFCAAGGDTYYAFKAASAQFDTGLPLDEVLMDYITTELKGVIGETYAEPQGRITQNHIKGELDGKTVILHTNDTHGALLGFAQVAKVRSDYLAKGAKVILVDAGDYSQGTTYVSTNKGEAAVTMMNEAGYDFVTLGNHEFDFGYAQLVENMKKAEFKPIVADVLLKETGASIFDGRAIKEVDGVKIGFFGMETPETFTKVNPGLIKEITFPMGEEMYKTAQAEVDALKEAGADIIIGLVHLGVDNESAPNRSIDLYKNVTGIDFLIDGHSHTVMTAGPDGEPIQSTGTKASKTALMNVGLIQIDNATKKIEKNELIPLGEEAAKNEKVAKAAKTIMDEVDAKYGAVFAKSEVDLVGVNGSVNNETGEVVIGNRNGETNNGNLITDALKWSVLRAGSIDVADDYVVALTNGGGIRAAIKKGDVTMNDINTVLPFGNTVAVVYVTGAELLEALEASTYPTPGTIGGFPQVSGIKYNIDITKAFDAGAFYPESTYHKPASINRVTIDNINGKQFDLEAKYAVVTNNFCAAGGDTYYAFKAASAQFDTGIPMDEAVMEYITEALNGVIPASKYAGPEGRITTEARAAAQTQDFVLSTELKGGDEVVLYNAGNGKAVTAEMAGYYIKGTDVTPDPDDHKIADPDAAIVWTVAANDDGTYTFRNGENVLAFGQSVKDADAGTYYNNLYLTEADHIIKWNRAVSSEKEQSYTVYAGGEPSVKYEHIYIEWYKSTFSAYDTSAEKATDKDFGIQFYVKGATYVEPAPGEEPETKTFTKVTAALEDWSGTYIIARAKDETTAYVFDGTFDKNENFATEPLNGDKITASTASAIVIEKSGDGYTFKANGGYLNGKSGANGLLFETNPAVGSIAWADGLPVITAASGTVFRFNNKTYTDASYLWFRFFKVDSSVTSDENTYVELYKLDDGTAPVTEPGKVETTFPSTSNDDIAKYGNIYTRLNAADFFENGFTWGDIVTVTFLDKSMDLALVPTYSYVDQGTAGIFVTKDGETGKPTGRVLLAINMGDFATTNGLATKTTNADKSYYWTAVEGVEFPVPVTLTLKEQGGYATEMAIRDINRTNNRADYPELTDAEFANFREVTTTGMGAKTLYRGSSPINPEIGRNTYADAELEKAGVTVVMNLANDKATAEAYAGYADTYYSKQNIVFLNLGVDFAAADFKAGLANGLRHFAENKGVYYVHCTEGKDRAGFVSALLECFMGATYDEVVADYLKTYTNYYTVVDGKQQALSEQTLNAIANSNIIKTLQSAFGVEDLKTADLAAKAEEYIKGIGLTDAEIAALKANLSGAKPEGFLVVEPAKSSNTTRFGHVDIDISVEDFLKQFALGDIVTVTVNGYTFDAPVVTNYDDVNTGEYLIRCASGKTVTTLAINYGQLGVVSGIVEKYADPETGIVTYVAKEGVTFPMYATITLKQAGGYADELAIRKLNRTNVRTDYADLTDAEFANFRAVTTNGMGENVLYRSSSPIDPDLGRNTYADAAAKAAGVKTFINLADTQAEAEAFTGYTDSYYSTQSKIFLGLPVAFTSEEFKTGLATGYRYITTNEAPYLIHCLEGKDRTGLSIAVLEALMGASLKEIQADYLKTYENYFDVKDGKQVALTDAQKEVLTGIITKNVGIIFDADLETADLKAEAEAYLTEIGMTAEEIATLKTKLAGTAEALKVETTFPSATKADIDKYGDVHFSITSADLAKAGFEYKDLVKLSFLGQEVIVPIIPQYRYVGAKATGLVMWEDGAKPAEVEVFNGSFAANYGLADVVRDGSEYTVTAREGVEFPVSVTIEMYEKQGYADTYAIFDLTRSNNREDYRGNTEPYPNLTDEEFANFRKVTTTGMGDGTLYRASSPVNTSIGRNTYADAAAQAAGVKSFVNLADSAESAAKYPGYTDSYYSKQNIAFLNLGVDFTTELNRTGLKAALEFIAAESSEAPFLVHCNEGQDRAGFVSALLECLMGATYDEVVKDYMVTFYNYYGVLPNTDQYKQISNNIVKNLSTAFGLQMDELATANLAEKAEAYLKELGVSEATIAAAKTKLAGTGTTPPSTESYYVKVTDAADLKAGDVIILVCESKGKAASAMETRKFFNDTDVTIADGRIELSDSIIQITLGGTADAWTLTTSEGVIGSTDAKSLNSKGQGTTEWTITIDTDGNATVKVGDYGRILYNVNSPRFLNYKSDTSASMLLPQIYKLVKG